MSIKAIILDLEGVLLRTKDADLMVSISNALHVPYDKVYEILFGEMNDQVDLGIGTQDDFDMYIIRELGLPEGQVDVLRKVVNEDSFIDDVFLARVKELRKSYKVALLSNYSNALRGRLEHEWKISDVFDVIVISCEVGVIKPGPEIFNLTLEWLGVRADEAVFVDDRMRNIVGAKKVGIRGVFYENREQALVELERMLGEK